LKSLLLILSLILSFSSAGFTREYRKFYYKIQGNINTGFSTIGSPSRLLPGTSMYAVSLEDNVGRKKEIRFYSRYTLLERRLYDEDELITYMEGLSSFRKAAWYEVSYSYQERGEGVKQFVKEIDHKIYKNISKKQNEILHREITYFEIVREAGKIWNVMNRRDFLPMNKFHHFWLFKYPSINSEKPEEIHEFDINGKLKRVGRYQLVNGAEMLVFKAATEIRR